MRIEHREHVVDRIVAGRSFDKKHSQRRPLSIRLIGKPDDAAPGEVCLDLRVELFAEPDLPPPGHDRTVGDAKNLNSPRSQLTLLSFFMTVRQKLNNPRRDPGLLRLRMPQPAAAR